MGRGVELFADLYLLMRVPHYRQRVVAWNRQNKKTPQMGSGNNN